MRRFKSLLPIIVLAGLLFSRQAWAQDPCSDFLESVVKIHSADVGAGVVLAVESSRIVIVTAAHVVSGVNENTSPIEVTFHQSNSAPLQAKRLLVIPENEGDIAILSVAISAEFLQAHAIPILVFRKSTDLVVGERVTMIGHVYDTDWKCVAQQNSITALNRGTDKRVLTSTRSGVGPGSSGGPLFDSFGQLIGITTKTIADVGGDVISTKVDEILLAATKAGVIPNRVVDQRSPDSPHPTPLNLTATADKDAVELAQRFLQFLGKNQLTEAYSLVSPTVRISMSLAQFVTGYSQYAAGMAGHQINRELSASTRQRSFLTPIGGPIQAETFILTFTTRDPSQPGLSVFEIVTLAKEQNRWGIVQFAWNTIATPTPGTTRSADSTANAPEAVARQVLAMIHANQLSAVYRDYMSDLQKHMSLTTEGAFVSLCATAASQYPGPPQSQSLISTKAYETLPQFFGSIKAEFLRFVFLSKYGNGSINEEIYLIKETTRWKIAVFLISPAL